MARPRLEISAAQVLKLAKLHCTNLEIAEFFGCSVDTLTLRFADILTKGRAEGKQKLRRLQWRSAEKGNAIMQIWLGKQYLDQKDKQEIDLTKDIIVKIGDDEKDI